MRHKLLVIGVFWLLVGMASCSSCRGGKSDLLSLLPADVPGVVVFPNLAGTVSDLNALKTKFSVGPLALFINQGHQKLKSIMGFDPLAIEELKKLGLAPAKGLAIVPSPNTDALLVVGVSNKKTFEAEVKSRMKELVAAEDISTSRHLGVSITTIGVKTGDRTIPRLHYLFTGDFALIAGPGVALERMAKLVELKPEHSLAGAKWFTGLTGKTPKTADILIVINGQKAETLASDDMQLAQHVNEGLVLASSLSPNGLTTHLFLGLERESAKKLNGFGTDVADAHLERYLPKSTVLAYKLRVNVGRILDELMSSDSDLKIQYQTTVKQAEQELQTNLEAGTIRNLNGNVVAGVTLGSSDNINRLLSFITEGSPEKPQISSALQAFIWMQVKDAAAWIQVIENLLSIAVDSKQIMTAKSTIGSLQVTDISMLGPLKKFQILQKGDLIGACMGDNCARVAADLLDKKSKGLPSSFSAGAKKLFDEPSIAVGYLNFAKVLDAVSNLDSSAFGDGGLFVKMVVNLALTVIQNLSELTGVINFEPEGVSLVGHIEIQ